MVKLHMRDSDFEEFLRYLNTIGVYVKVDWFKDKTYSVTYGDNRAYFLVDKVEKDETCRSSNSKQHTSPAIKSWLSRLKLTKE